MSPDTTPVDPSDADSPGEKLNVPKAAAMVGIGPSTWRSYVARNRAPKPDGHFDDRSPYWFESTVEEFRRSRHGRVGRPPRSKD